MSEESKSKVGELDDTLYSRTRYENPLDKRSAVRELETPPVEGEWQGPKLDEILNREREQTNITPFMKKFFTFALLFFAATLLVAGFVFFGGSNFISSKNVDITVVGPTAAPAGEVLELEVSIVNSNNADLELANFSVQYPAGSREPEDTSRPLTFTKESLGEIGAGEEVARNVEMFLVGQTGEAKDLKFSVEYKVKGSNATFYKDKIYQINIGSSPLSLNIQSPSSVTSGENFKTTVAITLNSREVLKKVMLRAEYPYGYSPSSAVPEAFSEKNLWALGDMAPGVTKKVEIVGKLLGENQDERTFRFYAGIADGDDLNPVFKSVIISGQETVVVERPAVGIQVGFNSENVSTYVAPAEQTISTAINFQNNMKEKLLNPALSVRFSGSAFNESSVAAYNNGFYNSGNDTLSWSLANQDGVSELSPGYSGSVSFSFTSQPEIAISNSREINLEIILTGVPVGSKTPITVKENRTVKIVSEVSLNSKAFYFSGPKPPKVEKTTTYKVIWTLGNTQSDVKDAKVTARLAPAVKLAGATSFGGDDFSYNEAANTITWNLGDLTSGTGFNTKTREVSFQVSLTPSTSQIGATANLVTSVAFTGFDKATEKSVTVTSPNLSTRLLYDPAFIQGDDIVVR